MVKNQLPKEVQKLFPFKNNFFKTSSGHQLHYIDEGKGHTIIMAHGNPTWSFYYRNLIDTLKNEFRVIAIDNMGCGLSDKPQTYQYNLKQHIINAQELIDYLNIDTFSLVLHDWGGAIGMGIATKIPNKVLSIILLNTAAFTDENIPWQINLCRTPFIGEFLIRSFNAFAFPATFMAVAKPLSRFVRQGLLYPYNNYKNRIATARFVQDIPMSKKHATYSVLKSIEEKLSLLTCPKFIIWGGQDFCFNDHFFKRWTQIYPKAETLYLRDSGHYVLEDSPIQVCASIKAFLEKNLPEYKEPPTTIIFNNKNNNQKDHNHECGPTLH
ncbi:MAG: alpha/beta fold hydrolase [Halobacteriovoraceae bacterium]|nr:alpha/beta fold hydrolase [Halobacteriovoraceae bacterium]